VTHPAKLSDLTFATSLHQTIHFRCQVSDQFRDELLLIDLLPIHYRQDLIHDLLHCQTLSIPSVRQLITDLVPRQQADRGYICLTVLTLRATPILRPGRGFRLFVVVFYVIVVPGRTGRVLTLQLLALSRNSPIEASLPFRLHLSHPCSNSPFDLFLYRPRNVTVIINTAVIVFVLLILVVYGRQTVDVVVIASAIQVIV